jgi:radical SAM protein with 4Fe4S-binding SPASM domain
LSVHLDLTYRCNERCIHCYLDHADYGEMNTAEIMDVMDQLAAAGVFFLVLSGGEIFLRGDLLELVEYARSLMFCVKLKTNGCLIGDEEAHRLGALHPDGVQVSIYSHRAEIHDAITQLPYSLERTLEGVRRLREQGVRVTVANVLMRANVGDYAGVKALARQLGAEYTIDPTITPMLSGDRTAVELGICVEALRDVFANPELVGKEFCAPPPVINDNVLDEVPCSAGHTACYISPYGEVYPCVQFPLPSGNLRNQKFQEIWQHSAEMQAVRSIRARDLAVCSTCAHLGSCTRCPGLSYLEGNMRGPSSQDCEKSYARTGILSANTQTSAVAVVPSGLVQIAGIQQAVS